MESPDVLPAYRSELRRYPAARGTLTFTPDTQEAIWQNMETGAAINFVAGPEGPTYTYTFGPRDALVLMIRRVSADGTNGVRSRFSTAGVGLTWSDPGLTPV